MPKKYAIELACDYLAACRTYGGNPRNEIDWWTKYSPKMKIHKETKIYLTNIFQGIYDGKTLKDAVNFANKLKR